MQLSEVVDGVAWRRPDNRLAKTLVALLDGVMSSNVRSPRSAVHKARVQERAAHSYGYAGGRLKVCVDRVHSLPLNVQARMVLEPKKMWRQPEETDPEPVVVDVGFMDDDHGLRAEV